MRISDWSSDVCSSDLSQAALAPAGQARERAVQGADLLFGEFGAQEDVAHVLPHHGPHVLGAEELDLVQVAGEMVEEVGEFLAVRGAAAAERHLANGRSVRRHRSEEHTSELQSLMRISYAVFCLNKKTNK